MVGIEGLTGFGDLFQADFLRSFEMQVVKVRKGAAVAHLGRIIRYRSTGRETVEDFYGVIFDEELLAMMAAGTAACGKENYQYEQRRDGKEQQARQIDFYY